MKLFPFLSTSVTLPRSSSLVTTGSAVGIASPRVDNLAPLMTSMTRCTNSRRSRPNKTMSPVETSSAAARSIWIVSPGQSAGNMLHPVTCKRSAPDERKTSLASSHLSAWASADLSRKSVMTSWGERCSSAESRPLFRTKGPWSQIPFQSGKKAFRIPFFLLAGRDSPRMFRSCP